MIYLLQHQMRNITQENRFEVARQVKERRRATQVNWRNKRNEDRKPRMNMKDPIQQTRESKLIKCEKAGEL